MSRKFLPLEFRHARFTISSFKMLLRHFHVHAASTLLKGHVFYPGGHGPLWDLAEDPASIRLIEATLQAGKPVALVCHAPGVLRHAKAPDGKPLVDGKDVTGFMNTEEEAVGLTEVVPFLVENELTRNGGNFSKADDWAPYVLADGLLITGQNPASSGPAAERLLKRLANR